MLKYRAFQADQWPVYSFAGEAAAVFFNSRAPRKSVTVEPVLSKGMATVCCRGLPAQTKGFDDGTVPIDVLAFYVVEQPAPLAHEHQQAAP